ncbi:MAG TPA: alpha-L-arabinofuranosidase C-terminal domain-containing protein [Armatimonadota bacterium]|nr:alpha-L-arabinofuranosidase C-terminal domain-containing protein [Armatimonadota bacterium]
MMRYPGGCLVHDYDWHNAVGPIDQRPNYSFGVDEFLAYCQAVGAEPLITVSDYTGTSQDAADLVEYLNAPADTRHPWALKRAQWGHPKPYGVRYFELGNESDHGNHNTIPHKKFSDEAYAQWVNTSAGLMRKVDPTIQIGAVVSGGQVTDPWNSTVLTKTKGVVNFIIIHTYPVGYHVGAMTDDLMQGCMATVDQTVTALMKYQNMIKKYSGKNLPLAITEYNASFVQEKPIPYRFSYGAALFCADYIRVLLQPKMNVLMANYWHFSNGYWGMIRGDGPNYKKLPAYYLYRLWAQHFGQRLVTTEVTSPRITFNGICGVAPCNGNKYQSGKPFTENLLNPQQIKTSSGPGYSIELRSDGILVAKLKNLDSQQYPAIAVIHAPKTGIGYTLSFEARTTNPELTNLTTGLGLALNDLRGWEATSSAIKLEGIDGSTEWKKFYGIFNTLPDCPGTVVLWRLCGTKASPATGTLEVRNIKVTAYQQQRFPAYNVITSSASLSADRKTLYLIIFNKHMTDNIPVTVRLKGVPHISSVQRWMVTGPSLASTNLDRDEVREVESAVTMPLPANGTITYDAPARSMTAIEVHIR